jgi:hypothetical protein
MNNWASFHLEHFQAHCKNSVSLSIEIRLALKGPWYRVSLSVPTGYPVRTGAAITPLINEILKLKENPNVHQVRVTEKCKEYGVHPVIISSLNCVWP